MYVTLIYGNVYYVDIKDMSTSSDILNYMGETERLMTETVTDYSRENAWVPYFTQVYTHAPFVFYNYHLML